MVIELLPHLQPSAPAKTSLKAIADFRSWFTQTNPCFTYDDAKKLLYGSSGSNGSSSSSSNGSSSSSSSSNNNYKNGIMQACGTTSKKKWRQRRDSCILLLAELIGLVATSPTHPDCQHCRNSAQCSTTLTQACVNAEAKILTSMHLEAMLQHRMHHETCQLVHTIVNLRSNSIQHLSSSELLGANSTAVDIYQQWCAYNPISLVNNKQRGAQRRTEKSLAQLQQWSDLPTVYGFDPKTGVGNGGVSDEIDLILRSYYTDKKIPSNQRAHTNTKEAIEKVMTVVFGRTDELGRQQGQNFPALLHGSNTDGEKEEVKKSSSDVQNDQTLVELVRQNFTSFVKAQKMRGLIFEFLTVDDDTDKKSADSGMDAVGNEMVASFLLSTSTALNKLKECTDQHFVPLIKQQEEASSMAFSVSRLIALDVITSFPSTIQQLLEEEDYDGCVFEFEHVVDFAENFVEDGNSSSLTSIHMYHTLDSVFQQLHGNMSERVARTDLPLETREHLVELYCDLFKAHCNVCSMFDTAADDALVPSTTQTVYGFVIDMFHKLEYDSIDRFASIFDTTCSSYTSTSISWPGTTSLQVCRRVVEEIYEDFNALSTSEILVDVMGTRQEKIAAKSEATRIYKRLVEKMVQHVNKLLSTWENVRDLTHEWFDVQCNVMRTFHPIMKRHSDIESTNMWTTTMSRDIMRVCTEHITTYLNDLDVTSICQNIRVMEWSSVKFDVVCLKSMEQCLSGCVRKKLSHIAASLGTKDNVQHHHSQDQDQDQDRYDNVDPLHGAIKQLGNWRAFECVLLNVLDMLSSVVNGAQASEEMDRFRTRLHVVLAEGSESLAERVVSLYETMLEEKIRLIPFDSELLMDIVCFKNDLMQYEWSGIDVIVGRLLAKVGMIEGSAVFRKLNSDHHSKLVMLALLPSQKGSSMSKLKKTRCF